MSIYKYYNYKDLEIVSSNKPEKAHLFIETDSSGTLYMVDSVDETLIYKTTDKCDNWTQPNGDFDRASDISIFWHDRTNGKLYCIDASNIFYITLSTDVITELGQPDVTDNGYTSGNPYDVFIIGTDLYCTMYSEDLGVKTGLLVYKWVDPNWVYQCVDDNAGVYACAYSYGTVVGTDFYFIKYDITNSWVDIMKFDSMGSTVANIERQTARNPPNLNQFITSYDGSDILYFVAEKTADSKIYLHSYSISDDVITTLGEYAIVLMLDRNTDSTADPPNNLEKAFHLTEDKVYQIPKDKSGRLNLISTFDFTDTIIGITDNFLIDDSGNMYEYVDLIGSIFNGIIYHSRNDISTTIHTNHWSLYSRWFDYCKSSCV